MLPNNLLWTSNSIRLTKEARLKKLRDEYEKKCLDEEEHLQNWNLFLGNKLCRNIATRGFAFENYGSYHLYLYNYDLPTVIDHVCAPIHQALGLDWKLSILDNGVLVLKAPFTKNPDSEFFSISLYEEDMQSCERIRVKVREKSDEELQAALLEASDRGIYEYRINCGGEE